jgi:hypothetical protein
MSPYMRGRWSDGFPQPRTMQCPPRLDPSAAAFVPRLKPYAPASAPRYSSGRAPRICETMFGERSSCLAFVG